MSNREAYTTARLPRELARRAKVVAAITGETIGDLLERIVTPLFDSLEREHWEKSRPRPAARPTRTGDRPPG